jgi:hypothetical protein
MAIRQEVPDLLQRDPIDLTALDLQPRMSGVTIGLKIIMRVRRLFELTAQLRRARCSARRLAIFQRYPAVEGSELVLKWYSRSCQALSLPRGQ